MNDSKTLITGLLLLILAVAYDTSIPSTIHQTSRLRVDSEAAVSCINYLPFSIWDDPEAEYYYWYGLKGKNLKGKTYQTGHAFELHVAVNDACTLEQKQQNKTVFINLTQFQKAASRIPSSCNLGNRTSFTYDYNGKIASASEYIAGIDCKTGQRQMFSSYFVQFKRATQNPYPTQTDYLNSNFVTIWTFYPKRI